MIFTALFLPIGLEIFTKSFENAVRDYFKKMLALIR